MKQERFYSRKMSFYLVPHVAQNRKPDNRTVHTMELTTTEKTTTTKNNNGKFVY